MVSYGVVLVLGCIFYIVQADAPVGHGGGINTGYPPALQNNNNQFVNPQPKDLFNGNDLAMSYFPDPGLDGAGPYPAANRQYYNDYLQTNSVHQGPKPNYQGPKPINQGPKPVYQGPKPIYQGPKPVYQGPMKMIYKARTAVKARPKPANQESVHPLKSLIRLVIPSFGMTPAPTPAEDASPVDQAKITKDIVAGLTQSARGLLGILVNGISTATGLVKGASTTFVSGVSTGSDLLQGALTTFRDHLDTKMQTPAPAPEAHHPDPNSPAPYYY